MPSNVLIVDNYLFVNTAFYRKIEGGQNLPRRAYPSRQERMVVPTGLEPVFPA